MKDSFWKGILVGSILPGLAYISTIYTTIQSSFIAEKPIAVYVIVAMINLIVVRFSFRAGKESFAKGIVLITFVAMILLLVVSRFKA